MDKLEKNDLKNINLKRKKIKFDTKTKQNKIIKDEIEKQFQSRKGEEQLQISIKRMNIIFDIKIRCQRMKFKDKLIQ